MVMHARKRQRINDGFYDSNSTSNINSSPVTTSNGTGDSARPNNRLWNSTRTNGTTHKLSPRSRGDTPKSRRESPRNEHSHSIHKSAKKVFGDWSEHVSSSAKVYYYNWRSEISQWDKPTSWLADEKHKQQHKTTPVATNRTPSSSKPSPQVNSNHGTPLSRRDGHRSSLDGRDQKYKRLGSNYNVNDKDDQQSNLGRPGCTGSNTCSSSSYAQKSKDYDRLHPHQKIIHTPDIKESPSYDGHSSPGPLSATCSTTVPTSRRTSVETSVQDDNVSKFMSKANTKLIMSDQFKNICDSSLIEHIKNWSTNSFYMQTKVDKFQTLKLEYTKPALKLKIARAKKRFNTTNLNHIDQKILFLHQRHLDIENGKHTSLLSGTALYNATTPLTPSPTLASLITQTTAATTTASATSTITTTS